MRRVLVVLAVLAGTLTMGLVTVPPTVAGAVTPTTTIYDSTVPAATSLISLAYQATQATEIGNQIQFATGTSRTLNNVKITMESFGCGTSGGWSTADCVTTPGATFNQAITLNLYNAVGNTVGSQITSVTQIVPLKYRPSYDSVHCPANLDPNGYGKWWDGTACNNSIATDATISLGAVTVPNNVIYGIEIRTSGYGDPALGGGLGYGNPCNAASNGCPYDSLNVALSLDPTDVTVGSDPLQNGIYWNTSTAANYCDLGTPGGSGTFRFDGGCWGDQPPYASSPYDVPAVQFNAEATCTTVCYVSPTGNDTNAGAADSPFATVQHAVGTVSSGGTVHVAAGTYNENVSITKSLTLLGANAGTRATGAPRTPESVISTSNAGNDYTVDVNASNVTVDGFTLRQTAAVTCPSCAAFGVQVEPVASGAVVTNNIISGMATTASSPAAGNPIGVDIGANSSTAPNNVTVSQNLIENIGSSGAQPVSALGIEVGDSSSHPVGTGLTVSGNHVTNVTSASRGAYGMIINRPTSGSSITGNSFDTIQGAAWARGIGLEANEIGASVQNNSIGGVSSTNPIPGAASDLYFESGFTLSGTSVTNNSLTGATTAGVLNRSLGAENVTTNWWGCAGGPNATGCSGAGGTGSLTLTPWIVSFTPDPAKAGQPGFWPTLVTVPTNTATITSASSVQIAQKKKLNFTVTTGGHPAATLSVVGLPAWVTFIPGTGNRAGTAKLSGTSPIGGGSYTFTIQANNGNGYPVTTQTFTVYSLGFSSPAAVNFSKAGGSPPFVIHTIGVRSGVTLSAAFGPSQAGLVFVDNHDGTATISGTPIAPAKTKVVHVIAMAGAAGTTQNLAVGITN